LIELQRETYFVPRSKHAASGLQTPTG